jgi:hypothetical protein
MSWSIIILLVLCSLMLISGINNNILYKKYLKSKIEKEK